MFRWIRGLFGRKNKYSTCKPEEGSGYIRDGAHVLVGTGTPLAEVFRFSGESEESFRARKVQAIEEWHREALRIVFDK